METQELHFIRMNIERDIMKKQPWVVPEECEFYFENRSTLLDLADTPETEQKKEKKAIVTIGDTEIFADDSFSIIGAGGVCQLSIRRIGGDRIVKRIQFDEGSNAFVDLDPSSLSTAEKRNISMKMFRTGISQTEIANLLDTSTSSIHNYILSMTQNKAKR